MVCINPQQHLKAFFSLSNHRDAHIYISLSLYIYIYIYAVAAELTSAAS